MVDSVSQKAVTSALKKHKDAGLSQSQISQATRIAAEIQAHIHQNEDVLAYKEKMKLAHQVVLAKYATYNTATAVLNLAKAIAASERSFAAAKAKKSQRLTVWQREIQARIDELWETEGKVTPVV